MSWISKNLTLDLIAIAIGGMQSAFDRIKSEPEPGTEWPAAEVPAQTPAAVDPAPDTPQASVQAAAAESAAQSVQDHQAAPEPQQAAEAPAPQVNRIDENQTAEQNKAIKDEPLYLEAQAHLRDISLNGGMDWITGTLFPSFNGNSLTNIQFKHFPSLIQTAVAFKLEKGLN